MMLRTNFPAAKRKACHRTKADLAADPFRVIDASASDIKSTNACSFLDRTNLLEIKLPGLRQVQPSGGPLDQLSFE